MTTPLATKYDVSAHVASLGVAERLPAMCVKETLTTVVSSISMKAASMTAALTGPGPSVGLAARAVTVVCVPCAAWGGTVIVRSSRPESPGAHRVFARTGLWIPAPMRLPEGEKGLLAHVVGTGDTVEINLDRVCPPETALGNCIQQAACPFPDKLSVQNNPGLIAEIENRRSQRTQNECIFYSGRSWNV